MPILFGIQTSYNSMFNRRQFLQTTGLSSLALLVKSSKAPETLRKNTPIVISTWAPNAKANTVAYEALSRGGSSLDAIEQGIKVTEADPTDNSVGLGGLPDRDGKVTLDACIMNWHGDTGAVMALEHILHPISVARLVMEKTAHVQLVGKGALDFAIAQGFKKTNLLTPQSEQAWKTWLKTSDYNPMLTVEELKKLRSLQQLPMPNHDTIGMLALDAQNNLSGGCSTSGLAFKMHGRVGDSPIIGAGLFVDNEVGAATATGVGEEVVKICGAHTVVELMRQGHSPEAACKKAVERIIKRKGADAKSIQVGFVALNAEGAFGAFALQHGFSYAVHSAAGSQVYLSGFFY